MNSGPGPLLLKLMDESTRPVPVVSWTGQTSPRFFLKLSQDLAEGQRFGHFPQ